MKTPSLLNQITVREIRTDRVAAWASSRGVDSSGFEPRGVACEGSANSSDPVMVSKRIDAVDHLRSRAEEVWREPTS